MNIDQTKSPLDCALVALDNLIDHLTRKLDSLVKTDPFDKDLFELLTARRELFQNARRELGVDAYGKFVPFCIRYMFANARAICNAAEGNLKYPLTTKDYERNLNVMRKRDQNLANLLVVTLNELYPK